MSCTGRFWQAGVTSPGGCQPSSAAPGMAGAQPQALVASIWPEYKRGEPLQPHPQEANLVADISMMLSACRGRHLPQAPLFCAWSVEDYLVMKCSLFHHNYNVL